MVGVLITRKALLSLNNILLDKVILKTKMLQTSPLLCWPKTMWAEWVRLSDFLHLSQTCKYFNFYSNTIENEKLWNFYGTRRYPHFSQLSICLNDHKLLSFIASLAIFSSEEQKNESPDTDKKSLQRQCFGAILYQKMHLSKWNAFLAFENDISLILKNTFLLQFVFYKLASENELRRLTALSGFAETHFTHLLLPSLVLDMFVQSDTFRAGIELTIIEAIRDALYHLISSKSSKAMEVNTFANELLTACSVMRQNAIWSLQFCRCVIEIPLETTHIDQFKIREALKRWLEDAGLIELASAIQSDAKWEENSDDSKYFFDDEKFPREVECFNPQTKETLVIHEFHSKSLFFGLNEMCWFYNDMFPHRRHILIVSIILNASDESCGCKQNWELATEFAMHEMLQPSALPLPVSSSDMREITSAWNVEFLGKLKRRKQIFNLLRFATTHNQLSLLRLVAAKISASLRGNTVTEVKAIVTELNE
jgi:hypothetical protein